MEQYLNYGKKTMNKTAITIILLITIAFCVVSQWLMFSFILEGALTDTFITLSFNEYNEMYLELIVSIFVLIGVLILTKNFYKRDLVISYKGEEL